jgi:hypothetical protein
MKNYAVIKNNIVVNIIVWDSITEYLVDGELVELKDEDFVDIGFIKNDMGFVNPNLSTEQEG